MANSRITPVLLPRESARVASGVCTCNLEGAACVTSKAGYNGLDIRILDGAEKFLERSKEILRTEHRNSLLGAECGDANSPSPGHLSSLKRLIINVINFIMNYLYLLRLASPLTTSGIIQNARPRFLEAAFLGRVLQPEPIAEC